MKELNTFRNFLNEGLFSRSAPDKEYESAMAIMNAIESIDTLTTNGHLDANVSEKMVFEMGELYTAIMVNASDKTKAKLGFEDESDDDIEYSEDDRYILYYTNKNGEEKSIGFISGLNAEDEFYRLMDDENIVSAKIDYVYTKSGKPELSMEFTKDESGEADVKFG
jgi:hypothetical protein